ncbi:MAG: L-aspartate oxidase [Saccharofermentanales bacterium]
MKRYIFNGDLSHLERIDTDVVIVGCGAAGLYTALNLDPGLKCVLLNKAGAKKNNSMYAQGGIATVIEPVSDNDDKELHFQDTLEAGAGLCDKKAVRVLVDEAWDNIKELIEIGVPFDKLHGRLLLTREGGHSKNRILHSGGDATGLHLTETLYEAACKRENIQILDFFFITDVLTDSAGQSAGIIALGPDSRPYYFAASKVVLATGGIGRVYRNSTNAVCASGDGIAAAERAGAELKDMEFVQFHPTALVHPDENGRFFLISEALRGEGAILRNRAWEPFMQGVHPLADLAPRDIVSRAIITEMKRCNIPNVYLDITSQTRDFLKHRFPTIYNECMHRGIDIAADWIPVIPVQHYFMGGIRTDIDGRTSIPGLYACGEAACTGIHGANRLASNSLLECLVFGRRCARDINISGHADASEPSGIPPADGIAPIQTAKADYDAFSSEIRNLMTKKCSIIKNRKDLTDAHTRAAEIFTQLDSMELNTANSVETYNRAQVALAVISAGLHRTKSVGAHFITDN